MERMQVLDGLWKLSEYGSDHAPVPAPVPGSMQQAWPFFDGIGLYQQRFSLELDVFSDGIVRLEFEKVDFFAEVHLNGTLLGTHTGGEERFWFDVTPLLRAENELTVRVICPNEQMVEGFTLGQTPHRNKVNLGVQPGQSIDTGGILGHVCLRALPGTWIEDLYVRPDWRTGRVEMTLTLESRQVVEQNLFLRVYKWGEKTSLLQTVMPILAEQGGSAHECSFKLDHFDLWSVDAPNLYVVEATYGEHSFARKFGFRHLEVRDGYFHLNGKRLFLKCSHTGNVFPDGLITSTDMDLLRRDFIYAKACGFNTIRFMAAMAREEQLELCDELGMMCYDETMAGWNLEPSAHMEQWYHESLLAMLKRDRNHPCVTICGFLNETKFGEVYETARDSLVLAREAAPDILFMLSSGRWDGEITTGSVSNPGSTCWQPEWGMEGSGERRDPRFDAPYASYVPGMGDQHLYPPFPQSLEMDDFVLNLGKYEKPVFLSEYGHGSQNNIVQEYKKYLEKGLRTDAEDAADYKKMLDKLEWAFDRYHLTGAYGFLEDFLLDTMRVHAKLRLRNLDCVRANPQICGYNITGLLDHALTGEGLWTYWREFKPQIVDTLRDGWAPLRWSVILDNELWTPGTANRIRVWLCNEDVLPDGEYAVTMRICGPDGLVWEEQQTLSLQGKAFATPVLEKWLTSHKPGVYTFSAQMENAAPLGGRRTFRVGEPVAFGQKLYTIGMTEQENRQLRAMGLIVAEGLPKEKALVLVGRMEGSQPETRKATVEALTRCALRGCNVVYLDGVVFQHGKCNEAFLPLDEKGCCYEFYNWLYHVDGACRRGGLLTGIADGILDSASLGPVYPSRLYEDIQSPDECDCAMLGCGLPRDGGTYTGLALGAYKLGAGKMVLNSFRILENLGQVYAAERLLSNITARYAVSGALEDLPAEAEDVLNKIRWENDT